MKRLRDEAGGGPVLDAARQLLRSAQPSPDVSDRLREVRRALVWVPPARGRELGRPAVVVGVLLIAGGAAGQGGLWAYRAWVAPAPVPVSAATSQAVSHSGRLPPTRSHVETASHPEVTERPAAPAARAPALPTERSVRPSPSAPQKRRSQGDVPPFPRAGDAAPLTGEAALVHSAVRALRRDEDPARAAELLDRYAARDPNGPLSEEALALRVEAALARKDPEACGYARQYLARHPGGQYREMAERAIKGPSCR